MQYFPSQQTMQDTKPEAEETKKSSKLRQLAGNMANFFSPRSKNQPEESKTKLSELDGLKKDLNESQKETQPKS